MGRADPHCHTTASDGMVSAAELVAGAQTAGLDVIAVCDHDTMAAAAETVARGEAEGVGVIAGQEVTTRWPAQTHVVGWFLRRPVPSGLSLAATVAAIHDQGGLAMIPHPFMPTWFASCQPGMLARLIESEPVDAIELIHTAPTTAGRREALLGFYEAHSDRLGAAVASSDSHFGVHDLSRAITEFEGSTIEDFRRAVETRATVPAFGRQGRVPLRLVGRQQVRSLVELPLRRLRGQL